MTIYQNAIYVKDADLYLKSEHVHDFKTYTWPDKRYVSLDGGTDYCRREGDLFVLNSEDRYEEWCLSSDDPFEHIADRLLWGHRGKDGDQPLTHRPIKELAARPDGINHLRAILNNCLNNCLNISPIHKRVVEYWLARHELAQEVIEG